MAIEDSNPERRNLVVLSMAIIAFYVGGCEIPEGVIELPLVKLKFTDPHGLACLVWIILGWFAFRYWIEMHKKIRLEFRRELLGAKFAPRFYLNILLKDFDRYKLGAKIYPRSAQVDTGGDNGVDISFSVKACGLKEVYSPVRVSGTFKNPYEDIELHDKSFKKYLFYMYATPFLFFREPSLSANVAPLCLFIAAVLFGIFN